MNRFWIEELKNKYNEIKDLGYSYEEILEVADAYECINRMENIVIKEGILSLDGAREMLNLDDESQNLFNLLLRLIVDGTDPEIVRTIGINKCITLNLPAYKGLMNLMYAVSSLMIQAGDRPWVVEDMLKSMMPKAILDEINKRETEDNKESIENHYPMIDKLSNSINGLSDENLKKLLKDTDVTVLSMAMKGLPGQVRARIFKNMSPDMYIEIATKMVCLDEVKMPDAEENCDRIMKILNINISNYV